MNKKDLSFEDSMEELDKIATELEGGKLTLDESIKKFEDGMKLSKKCNEFLENAEKKITILVDDNGEIKEKNFIQDDEM